jgi:hypothetical protein
MNEAVLGILITADDTASPKLQGLSNVLTQNRTAFRQLAMGVMYLGSTFLSMGIALQNTNSAMGKSIGQTMVMVGGIMTAIGSALEFISAISKIVTALKAFQVQEMLTQAFMPGVGWATLAVGAVAAAGIGGYAYGKSNTKAEKGITVNNTFNGTVLTEKQAGETIRKQIVLTQQRTGGTSGIQ